MPAKRIWVRFHDTGLVEHVDTSDEHNSPDFLVREYQLSYGNSGTVWAGLKRDDPGRHRERCRCGHEKTDHLGLQGHGRCVPRALGLLCPCSKFTWVPG